MELFFQAGENLLEVGVDEAGRGCLAGPVCAAAVILPSSVSIPGIKDSKLLKPRERKELRKVIEREAISFGVAMVNNEEIDKINILQASIKAMHLALSQLNVRPSYILIDGNYFRPFEDIPYHCIPQGDAKYTSIAAASILAKTYRDDFMEVLHAYYPIYGWKNNKGYATKEHREAVWKYGFSPFHRRSFHLKERQLKINF